MPQEKIPVPVNYHFFLFLKYCQGIHDRKDHAYLDFNSFEHLYLQTVLNLKMNFIS